jgi:hypothetical protein
LKKYSLMYNEAAYTIWQGQIHANCDSPPKLIDFHLLRVKSHSNALVRTYILFLALSRNNEFLCIKNSCGRYFDRKNLLSISGHFSLIHAILLSIAYTFLLIFSLIDI